MTKIISRETIKGKLIGSFRKSKSALYILTKMTCSLNKKLSWKFKTSASQIHSSHLKKTKHWLKSNLLEEEKIHGTCVNGPQ